MKLDLSPKISPFRHNPFSHRTRNCFVCERYGDSPVCRGCFERWDESYCFLRIFLNIGYWKIALGVLLFACLVEILQYFDYVELLGWENNRVLSVGMGRTFEWSDFLAIDGFFVNFVE